MWNSRSRDESKTLHWEDFPAAAHNLEELGAPAITAYLRRILDEFEDSEFIKYLVIPSPLALSGFFHSSEDEIFNALQELRRQGYEYEATGQSGPITLWDPLIRRKSPVQSEPMPWQVLYQSLFHPARHQAAG
ncbi:MAG TPA: hypothetical protein V6C52_00415 [Coleofasciculaceae cyanobacterium]|jgi:hypothetical protein